MGLVRRMMGPSNRAMLFPTSLRPVTACSRPVPCWRNAGLTLVEVMVSLTLMATVMVGFIASFVQSRRVTESNVLHAAATSMIYGVIEQIKQLDYFDLLPNYETDPFAPTATTPPYLRVRINQSTVVWLKV